MENTVFTMNTKGVQLEKGRAYTVQELRELGLAHKQPRYASTYNISEWRAEGLTEAEIDALVREEDRRQGYDAPEPKMEKKELDLTSIFGSAQ